MDALLREIERQLSPETVRTIREILNAPRPLSIRDLRLILAAIIAVSDSPQLVMRYLILLARAGLVSAEGVGAAIIEAEAIIAESSALAAGGGAAAEAGAGGSAATGGAVAGGLTAGALIAILAAVLAVLYAGYAIYTEFTTPLYTPPVPPTGGAPCGIGTPGGARMSRLVRSISVWGIGQRSTLNKAIRQAEAICNADAGFCGGTCPGGLTCAPDVAIQSVDIFPAILATRVVLTFTCPCVCK
jgi:hypothetical protein